MFGLSGGEEIMTLALFVLIQYHSATDGRQTDRRTDMHVCYSIACYATALVKLVDTVSLLRI